MKLAGPVLILLCLSSCATAEPRHPGRPYEPEITRRDAPYECSRCGYPLYEEDLLCPRCGENYGETEEATEGDEENEEYLDEEATDEEYEDDAATYPAQRFLKRGSMRSYTTPAGIWYRTLGFTAARRTIHVSREDPDTGEFDDQPDRRGNVDFQAVEFGASTGLSHWWEGGIRFPVDRTLSEKQIVSEDRAVDTDEWGLGDVELTTSASWGFGSPWRWSGGADMTLPTSSNEVAAREKQAYSGSLGLDYAGTPFYAYVYAGAQHDLDDDSTTPYGALGAGYELGELWTLSVSFDAWDRDLSTGLGVSRVLSEAYLLSLSVDVGLLTGGRNDPDWAGMGLELQW